MAHNRWGAHWANVPIGEQLGQWALGMGGDCYLVIDGGYGWIPRIREARPNAIIVHRHAVSNWMPMDPETWAQEMNCLFHEHKQYTKHIELECEPDIFPNFPGWGQPIVERLKYAAWWNEVVARKLRAWCPDVIIHSPPLAHERIDLPQWFAIWKPVLDVCDVLDMHCYWEKDGKYFRPGLYSPEESYHRAFRYRKIHDFLESQNYHIPMMVTECGNFAPYILGYADELTYYFSELEKDADYMIGGCVFILKSNQWNRVNDLTRQPNIERFFRRLREAPKKDIVYPSEEEKMETPIRVLGHDTMELEEYLKGVVPYEIGPGAPIEALKAQAVAARCYAMNAIKSPRHAPDADVCATTHCQVWKEGQYLTTTAVVEATKGIVATSNGEVINAFYSGHCDGKTRRPTNAHPTPWMVDSPYLIPVDCVCGYDEMYGHGVGMCQQGAIRMAQRGASYKEILWHYYRGTWVDGEQWEPPKVGPIQEALEEIAKAKSKIEGQNYLNKQALESLDAAEEKLLGL